MTWSEEVDLAFATVAARAAGKPAPPWPAGGISRKAFARGADRYFREIACRLDRLADEGTDLADQEAMRREFDDMIGAAATHIADAVRGSS